MFPIVPKRGGLRFLLGPFLGVLFATTLWRGWILQVVERHPYLLGDWLINYRGGFVRRGLFGEGVWQVHEMTGVEPSLLVFVSSSFLYLCFFAFSFLLLRAQRFLRPWVILLVSPFLFTFQIHTREGGFRKEMLFVALLSLVAWSSTHLKQHRNKERIFHIALLVYPLAILSHEMLAVYLPYLVIVYYRGREPTRESLLRVAGLLALSVAAFLAAISRPGDQAVVAAICDSLGAHVAANCRELGSIFRLATPAGDGWTDVLRDIRNTYILPIYAMCVALAAIAYVPLRERLKRALGTRLALWLFMTSLAGTIVLASVARDWGRFLYLHLVSIFLLLLTMPETTSQDDAQSVWGGKLRTALLCAALLAYASLWHLPNCCGEAPFVPTSIQRLVSVFTD